MALGLVHALTPGHGKAIIFSYFLGHNADPFSGIKVAAGAAVTHGSIAVILVLIAGRVISPLGRPTGAGAWLELTAGLIVAGIGALYVVLSLRGLRRLTLHSHGAEASRPFLAIAMGLLPCPLTIIVVGSAINQGATLAGIVPCGRHQHWIGRHDWLLRLASPSYSPPIAWSGGLWRKFARAHASSSRLLRRDFDSQLVGV